MKREMKISARVSAMAVIGALITLGATACVAEGAGTGSGTATTSIQIIDNHGTVTVPKNPERVVALDNTIFDTLSDWDIPLVAAPKGVMGAAWPEYVDDTAVLDVGDHRNPNLEVIVGAKPDVILTGYRFGSYYDELVAQNPDAVVIEITPRDGKDTFEELIRETQLLGQIFDRGAQAQETIAQLTDAISEAKQAYNGSDTVMAVNTSAGSIGYLAPVIGRSLGPVFPALDLVPALEVAGTSDHRGDDIGVEAIAQSNPDWILALDRDAAFVPEERDPGSAPAEELLSASEALKQVTAVQRNHVVILDSNFYLTEGIQAYTQLFSQLRDAFTAE